MITDAPALPQARTPAEAARVALRCLDLTSLNDGDTEGDIERLVARAQTRWGPVAAVCVWPRLAGLAARLAPPGVRVAAVANFPAGGSDVDTALRDVHRITEAGAHEVDLVLPWRDLMAGQPAHATRVVAAVRRASRGLTLKLILESGELASPALIAEAARLGLGEGVDFLKTSTGKASRHASLDACATMLAAIHEDPQARDRVGLKPSGGIRTVADTLPYLALVERAWGAAALTPSRLRIGASSLLGDIDAVLGGARPLPAPSGASGY